MAGFLSAIGTAIWGVFTFIVVLALLIVLFKKGYVKAPPDKAWVISGRKEEMRFIHGKSSLVIPFLERKDELNLSAIPVQLQTKDPVLTRDFIEVVISASVNVQIDTSDKALLQKAAKNWLGDKHSEPQYIASYVAPVLEGNLREIAGQIDIQDLVRDRQQVAEKAKESAEEAMQALGLTIRTFNISSIEETDPESRILKSLGAENTAKILKSASVSKAENARIIREEQAKNEQLANQAEVDSQLAIAERENNLRIQLAELKTVSDQKQADANIAGRIQEENRRRELEQATVDANIARREREAELAAKEVAIQERKLEAQIKKEAEAQRYAAEQKAEADLYKRTKDAEAAKIEQSNDAEAKLIVAQKEAEAQKAAAEAAKFAKLQEAEGIEAVGAAEAAAIAAKGDAEAEALDKKAEAMRKFEKAAMMEQILAVMPDIAHEVAAPMANIDKVSIYGGSDGASGFGAYGDAVPAMMAKVFETVKDATGLDIVDLMSGEGKQANIQRDVNLHFDSKSRKLLADAIAGEGDEPIEAAGEMVEEAAITGEDDDAAENTIAE